LAAQKSLEQGTALLEPGEHEAISVAIGNLQRAIRELSAASILAATEDLDRVSTPFAARRMNFAIARAISGRDVSAIEASVAHAEGVDEKVASHQPKKEEESA
jgi:molecular chaperone HscA